MSLTLTLNNALTGLRASAKQTDLIANNVANSLTEGYGRRDAALTSASVGGAGAGVSFDGVTRAASPFVTASRRLADAEAGWASTLADAQNRLAGAVGQPGGIGALATEADRLDAALAAAADTPESAALLSTAVSAAGDYASAINRAAQEVAALRTEADASIAAQVSTVNATLSEIEKLNEEIQLRSVGGRDIAALEDQRDRLISRISDIVPVKIAQRPNDGVAIFTRNGGQLLDGRVFPLEFTPTSVVTPDRTLAGGGLSGLTQNGNAFPIGLGDGRGFFDGGTLSAAFEVRDRIGVDFSDGVDAIAADLMTRVQGLPADPTLTATDPGLFTDGGIAYDPANVVGAALRIEVNALVDPLQGGDPTRLRDGLLAAAPGDAGDATVLRGLQDSLLAAVPAAGGGLTGQRSVAGFAAELSAATLSAASLADLTVSFRAAQRDALSDAEVADIGVDTDQELSRLLLVEQAYAANARVIQVVDELLERLVNL